MSQEQNHEIFLSYSRKNKDDIDELYEILTKKYKLNVWKDTHSIRTGNDFREEIYYGIEKSKLVLSCITKEYLDSKNCIKELKIASKLDKKYIFVMLEQIDIDNIPAISMLTIDEQRCNIYKNKQARPSIKLWSGDIFEKFVKDIGDLLGRELHAVEDQSEILDKLTSNKKAKNKKYDLFMSCHVEIQPTVQSLQQQLEINNFATFFDTDGKNTGWRHFMNIKDAIDSSTVFVCCANSNYLTNEKCRNEIEYASDNNKRKIVVLFEEISSQESDKMKKYVDIENAVRIYEDRDKSFLFGTGNMFKQLIEFLQVVVKEEKDKYSMNYCTDKMQRLYDLFITYDPEQLEIVASFVNKIKSNKNLKIFHDVHNNTEEYKPNFDAIKNSETVLAIVTNSFLKTAQCVEEISFAHRNDIPTNIIIESGCEVTNQNEVNLIVDETSKTNIFRDVNLLSRPIDDSPLIKNIENQIKESKEPKKTDAEINLELTVSATAEIRLQSATKLQASATTRQPSITTRKSSASTNRISSAIKTKANATDQISETKYKSIYEASEHGDLEEIKYWLKNGRINDKDAVGLTALHIASRTGNLPIVQYLCENNANVNEKDNDKRSPIHLAAIDGHVEVVKYLCEVAKCNINDKDWQDMTPLHLASSWGHLNVIVYLCEHNAKINERSKDGWTPLLLATKNRRDEIAKYLREHGGIR